MNITSIVYAFHNNEVIVKVPFEIVRETEKCFFTKNGCRYLKDEIGKPYLKSSTQYPYIELVMVDVVYADLKRTDALEQALLKVSTDAHDLARCLHLRAEVVGCGSELVEGEAGKLCDHVVKLRLKRRVGVGDLDLLK